MSENIIVKWCRLRVIALLWLILMCSELCVSQANKSTLSVVPQTNFECGKRAAGYYADIETGCQVYHMCDELGRQFSYACPNTTLFQQRMLICDHWYMVNCSDSERNYDANLLIGQRDKPFVRDEEHELRTPRPDLLDRPFAPDYTGETLSKQYKTLPALQNSLSGLFSKSHVPTKRARAPIEQLRPFSAHSIWSKLRQEIKQEYQPRHNAAASTQFQSQLRRDDEVNNDLKVASSQDSRRSENEDNVDTPSPSVVIQPPSSEYAPPFFFPRYNENYTAESAVDASQPPLTTTPYPITSPSFSVTASEAPKLVQLNEIDFPDTQNNYRSTVQPASTKLPHAKILTHGNSVQNDILGSRHRPTTPPNTPTPFETNELLPVVPSKEIRPPATGLLPPFDTFIAYQEVSTPSPSTFLEWKVPASGLEPPKFELDTRQADENHNQLPVLPPIETASPTMNIPIVEKELVPPIYDINRLTFTKIRVPTIEVEPPKLVSPIFVDESPVATENHTFPSFTPVHGAIPNVTDDKTQTQRSVVVDDITNNITTTENNYLALQKEFLIPSYTFPLETIDERPNYESNNIYNSFQVKLPDGNHLNKDSNGNQWYGENAQCPECHPSFLKPGTCEPCVKFR